MVITGHEALQYSTLASVRINKLLLRALDAWDKYRPTLMLNYHSHPVHYHEEASRHVPKCKGTTIHSVFPRVGISCKIQFFDFDVYVAVHRETFLKIKPNRCTNFSNLFLEWNSTCYGQFFCPSSGVLHCTYNSGICHTGLLTACEQDQDAVCTVKKKNSWWWTEEPFETCRVSFQE